MNLVQNNRSFRISVKNIRAILPFVLAACYCSIVLCLPNSIINNTSIYSMETPSYIYYKYFSYHFSFLFIPIVVYAFLVFRRSESIRFFYIILLVFITNCFFICLGENNYLAEGYYGLFLIMVQASSICTIAFSCKIQKDKMAVVFLDIYFFVSFISLIFGILGNQTIDGRYYFLGLGVGGTGYLSCLYILLYLYCLPKGRFFSIKLLIGLISLILSGQRTCIIMLVIFLMPLVLRSFLANTRVKRSTFIGISVLIFSAILFIVVFSNTSGEHNYLVRVLDALQLFASGNIGADSSVEGRIASLLAGLFVIRDHPLGIVNNYYRLQQLIMPYAFPTFPHSSLICDMILWTTPIALFCFIYIIRLYVLLQKRKDEFKWIVLFIIIMNVIWGSPELIPALLFFRLFFISLARQRLMKPEAMISISK